MPWKSYEKIQLSSHNHLRSSSKKSEYFVKNIPTTSEKYFLSNKNEKFSKKNFRTII